MSRRVLPILAFLCFALTVRGEEATAPQEAFTLTLAQWLTLDSSTPISVSDRGIAGSFDRSTRVPASDFANRFPGARVLASASYTGKPGTLASDLSRQLRQIEDIPADSLAPLLVEPAKTDRANAVSAEWAWDALQAEATDTVGALVLWYADESNHSLLDGASPKPQLVLVLFRATGDSTHGYQLLRLAWGNIGS